MIDAVFLEVEDKMSKAIDVARNEFSKIRSGRANPELFTQLLVDYYGAPTPLQQIATVSVPEARVSIRSVRRKGMDELDRIKKDGDAGEDEVDRAVKDLDARTKKFTDQIDSMLEAKEKDLMEI